MGELEMSELFPENCLVVLSLKLEISEFESEKTKQLNMVTGLWLESI